jgi:pimeloyl-ACP methyl ester carboxylesterase
VTLTPWPAAHAALDAWLDRRFDPDATAAPLLATFAAAGLGLAEIEQMLRAGRVAYPPLPSARGRISDPLPLVCDHVDHSTAFLLYVPRELDPEIATPLLVIGHGGHSGRDLAFAEWAARIGMEPWREVSERLGWVLLAPLTDRGWGAIGNSILFSAISRVNRMWRIDPERVFLTGHSMGGHLVYRSAMNFPDRFAGVSPMSGGYDYVADRSVENLVNTPGFATWGAREPFGIREANRRNRDWLESYGADWRFAECEGGHEIFAECIPEVADFFRDRPRMLYRERIDLRGGGPLHFDRDDANAAWGRVHAWRPGRAIPTRSCHWLELEPLPPGTPPERAVQELHARRTGHGIEITATNARRVHVHLHPRMVDLTRPVRVIVNGVLVHDAAVPADASRMLELARDADDRGRIFHASLALDVPEILA